MGAREQGCPCSLGQWALPAAQASHLYNREHYRVRLSRWLEWHETTHVKDSYQCQTTNSKVLLLQSMPLWLNNCASAQVNLTAQWRKPTCSPTWGWGRRRQALGDKQREREVPPWGQDIERRWHLRALTPWCIPLEQRTRINNTTSPLWGGLDPAWADLVTSFHRIERGSRQSAGSAGGGWWRVTALAMCGSSRTSW